MSFTIKELEALSGIKAHTIRIWEQRYHFLKPSRTQTNIRKYTNEELKTLLTVALLNKNGYKISRIDHMPPEQRLNTILQLNDQDARREQVVNELIAAMIDLDMLLFEKILMQQVQEHGILNAITSVIFLFLDKVGILWQTNRINPVHEHIATNCIRQKLISAIDHLPATERTGPLFLLFLPEGEHHELGLLVVYLLLKQRGLPVVYLGANVPQRDVIFLAGRLRPRYLYMHLTSLPPRQSFLRFVTALCGSLEAESLILSGQGTARGHAALPEGVKTLDSLNVVMDFLDSL